MNLELSADEASTLEEILESSLRELRVEVRRTETPAYHDELEQREKRVVEILDRLRAQRAA
jgi:hypothetical protein